MAVNSGEECQSAHGLVVLLDGGTTDLHCDLHSTINNLEVSNLMNSELCLNSGLNLQKHSNLKVDEINSFAPYSLDIDLEKGMEEIPKSNDESVANLKSDDSFARDVWLQIGGKLIQFLMNHGTELPKFSPKGRFVAERVYDTLTSRTRKYRRYPSFNSRRVVLLFSVLSSMGTIVLIYLTLRVRQISDVASNL